MSSNPKAEKINYDAAALLTTEEAIVAYLEVAALKGAAALARAFYVAGRAQRYNNSSQLSSSGRGARPRRR